MIPTKFQDFYGDVTRWFLGIVKSVDDPLELGRLQVRIYGIHGDDTEQIPDADLPWAQVIVPITQGGHNGIGNNLGIQVGARVCGMFLDGQHSQDPIIFGSVPKIEEVTEDSISSEPEISKITTSKLATGTNLITTENKPIDGNIDEPDHPYAATYPNNKVQVTPRGHVIEIDDTTDAERIHIYHRTGSFIEIHPSGDVVTHSKNAWKSVTGNDREHVTTDKELVVDNDYTMTIRGNLDIQVAKNVTINGKQIDLNSTSTQLKGRILYDDAIAFEVEELEVTASDTALVDDLNTEGGPANSDLKENNDDYDEKSPVTCGQVPQTNPYDMAKSLKDDYVWKETPTNENIKGLWKEIGYTTNADKFTANGTAWCATFVGATLKRSGNKYIQTASSQAYKNYGTEVDYANDLQQGDIVVFHRKGSNSGLGHTGFATGRQTDTHIEVLGGNQGNDLTTRWYPKKSDNQQWGITSVRRATSCEDGTTAAPAATTTADNAGATGGSVV